MKRRVSNKVLLSFLMMILLMVIGCSNADRVPHVTITHGISGTVTDANGAGVLGVTINLAGDSSWSTMTDSSGKYGFYILNNGSYTVTPSLTGYIFSPASATITITGANIVDVNFTATAVTNTALSAPTGVTATPGDGQVTIAWTAVSGATSYNIYWSATTGVTTTNGNKITGATNPYHQTGLNNGTTYYYVVTAVNSAGESAASTQVSAIPALKNVSIVFNYDYDTNGFFTTERRALVEQAAATLLARMGSTTWERVDPSLTGGSYELALINPSTWAYTWSSNVVIPKNQITVYLGAIDFSTFPPSTPMNGSKGGGCSQLMSIRNVSGNIGTVLISASQFRPVNSSISFDLQGIQGFSSTITKQWHFDSDGNITTDDRDPSDPHYNDYYDFVSAFIHELGHVLGINSTKQYSTMGWDYDPNFCLAWMSRVQSDGSGGYVFTGSNAKQLYYGHAGVNIPLETSSECHWADGVRSGPSGAWPSVTHEAGEPFRVFFSEMEFQALKDIGYTISAP